MEAEQATLELRSQQGELLDEEQERHKECVVLAAAKNGARFIQVFCLSVAERWIWFPKIQGLPSEKVTSSLVLHSFPYILQSHLTTLQTPEPNV